MIITIVTKHEIEREQKFE